MNIFKSIALMSFLFMLKNDIAAQANNKVKINNLRLVNTAALDFSPAFFHEDLLFVSNNPINGHKKAFDKQLKSNTMSLFISKKDRTGYYKKPTPFDSVLLSHVHDGPVSFDGQNEILYFTRNDNKDNGQKARYVDKVNHMKIYMASLVAESWSEPQLLPFNEEKSDACHPSVSADGQRLFFASNRSGGFGGMDLYVSTMTDGVWDDPTNLGPTVNSNKDDVFPFIHADGTLYFASNRPKTQGGLDIFYTRIDNMGNYLKPIALEKPFNTDKDDFGFIVDADNKKGFLSSNRNGGMGGDDIYNFTIAENTKPFSDVKQLSDAYKKAENTTTSKTITIYVIERKTGLPLSKAYLCTASTGANTPSVETAGNNCETVVTDENGKAVVQINNDNNYFIRVNKTEFKPNNFTILKADTRLEAIILLDRLGEKVDTNTTVAAATTLKAEAELNHRIYQLRNIYYDYDNADIRPESRIVLDSLIEILNEFPDMEIELAAHADSRGNVPYNINLSKRRANSVIDYLASNGIKRRRLNAIGYGKQQLANECGDGIPCPPEKHQENRRTEVRIVKSGGSDGKIIGIKGIKGK